MGSKAIGNFTFVRNVANNFLTKSRYFSSDASIPDADTIKNNPGRLIVSRHGESNFNVFKIWAGWHDAKITKKGEEQAVALGRTLKENQFSPDIVYTTQLQRAKITTQIALSAMQSSATIKEDARMLEQHVGDLTGVEKTEAGKKIVRGPETRPEAIGVNHPYHVTNSKCNIGEPQNGLGAESRSDVIVRVGEFFDQQLKADLTGGKNVLVVAHSNSLKALFDYIAKGKKREDVVVGNAEPIEVKFKASANGDLDFVEIVKISLTPNTQLTLSERKNLKGISAQKEL